MNLIHVYPVNPPCKPVCIHYTVNIAIRHSPLFPPLPPNTALVSIHSLFGVIKRRPLSPLVNKLSLANYLSLSRDPRKDSPGNELSMLTPSLNLWSDPSMVSFNTNKSSSSSASVPQTTSQTRSFPAVEVLAEPLACSASREKENLEKAKNTVTEGAC
jgi:hypothetical protein